MPVKRHPNQHPHTPANLEPKGDAHVRHCTRPENYRELHLCAQGPPKLICLTTDPDGNILASKRAHKTPTTQQIAFVTRNCDGAVELLLRSLHRARLPNLESL